MTDAGRLARHTALDMFLSDIWAAATLESLDCQAEYRHNDTTVMI